MRTQRAKAGRDEQRLQHVEVLLHVVGDEDEGAVRVHHGELSKVRRPFAEAARGTATRWRLAGLLGWEIGFRSELGKGSEFTVAIPRRPRVEAPLAAAPQGAALLH